MRVSLSRYLVAMGLFCFFVLGCEQKKAQLPEGKAAAKEKPLIENLVAQATEWQDQSSHWAIKSTWKWDTRGAITELDMASSSGRIWVTTIPDFDRSDTSKDPFLYGLSHTGRVFVRKKLDTPARQLSSTVDGAQALVVLYDNRVIAVGEGGRAAWQFPKNCRPFGISKEKVGCFFDDDSETRLGVTLLNSKNGQELRTLPVQRESIELRLDPLKRFLGILLSTQELLLTDADLKLKSETGLANMGVEPILDYRISSGKDPAVYVLSRLSENPAARRLRVLDSDLKLTRSFPFSLEVDQLALGPEEDHSAFFSGNRAAGATLAFMTHLGAGEKTVARWIYKDPKPFVFSSGVKTTPHFFVTRFHRTVEESRGIFTQKAWIGGWDHQGVLQWKVPMNYGEGWQLLSVLEVGGEVELVTASEKGVVLFYRLAPSR